jgi:hypothetical protein
MDNSNRNEYRLGNEMKASTTIGKITTKDNKDKDILHLHNLNSVPTMKIVWIQVQQHERHPLIRKKKNIGKRDNAMNVANKAT